MKLSIIIPAYNEEKTIGEVLDKIRRVELGEVEKEIIVVDDGSRDKTVEIAENKDVKVIKHAKNIGKGGAIKTGINRATGNIILIQDADLEYEPNEYGNLIKPIMEGKTKVVYGSRILWQRQRKEVLEKKHSYSSFYLGGRILTVIANLLYNIKITDEPTCYKVFDAEVLKSLNLKCKRFEFCPEVTAKVAKRGYKILEIPTPYYPRTFEEGKKIKFKDGLEAVWTLVKYKFRD